MTRQEAEKLAELEYPEDDPKFLKKGLISLNNILLRSGYKRGLLAGFEKGVRESAEVARLKWANSDVTLDKDSILQLLKEE